jgi:hypothetical protein
MGKPAIETEVGEKNLTPHECRLVINLSHLKNIFCFISKIGAKKLPLENCTILTISFQNASDNSFYLKSTSLCKMAFGPCG